jgi:opacity protein-like surface antigen
MFRRFSLTTAAALVAVVLTAAPAHADWLFTPYLGVTFGGDTNGQNVTYGASLGWMGAGVIGFEVDGAFAPDLFDEDDGLDLAIQDSNATTLMANLIVGAPLGPVRPYASGGIGLIRTRVADADEFFDIDDNSFGVNVGAGIMGFVSDNVGLRGDVRYFRSIQDSGVDDDDFNLDFGSFDFWRATFGVTFKF